MHATTETIFERRGMSAASSLNRPKALNALTLPMIRAMTRSFAPGRRMRRSRRSCWPGRGEKAFCAGGDVRAVYEAGRGSTAPTDR